MPKLTEINKKYGYGSIFDHFSLELAENKVSVIMGVSGIGKTTLLNILAGLENVDGKVEVEKPVSYVFQSDRLIKHLTIRQNLEFVLKNAEISRPKEVVIDEMLETVGLLPRANSYPTELSGGEKQRVSIARAFVYPAKTLLLDEPFSSLDYGLKMQLMSLLTDLLKKNNRTVVYVTHDVDEALALSDDVYILDANKVIYKKSLTKTCGLRPTTGSDADLIRAELYDVLLKLGGNTER